MFGIIYKITNNVNGKMYIGQTIRTLEERVQSHIWDCNSGKDQVLYHAIRKYGIKNFSWEVICEARDRQELDDMEIHYISEFNTYIHAKNSNGYNMTLGGEGVRGYIMTEAHRMALSKAHTGKIVSEETRRRMSENANHNGENNPMYGKTQSEESIKKNKENQPATKGLIQLTLDGEFVAEYDSVSDGARAVNGDRSAIKKVCKGLQSHHKGYKWILRSDYVGHNSRRL